MKITNTPNNNRNINKSLDKNTNINVLSYQKTSKNNISNQSINYMNNIIKDNNKIDIDKSISNAGKTFTQTFFKKYSDNKNCNNLKYLNNYFSASNNILNNYRKLNESNKNINDKINYNYNYYASKRPLDRDNNIFRKKVQKIEKKPSNIKEGINEILNKRIDIQKEDKKTINTENTILNENEEIIGRNLPH